MKKLLTFLSRIKYLLNNVLNFFINTIPGPDSISPIESSRKDFAEAQMSMDIQNFKNLNDIHP